MASDNLKTALEISVGVQGADKLSQLADGLDDIAREAGTAAPAFGDMAGGLREAGAQTGTLADKQGELAQRTRDVGAAAEKSAQQQVFSHRKVADGVQSISTQLDSLQKAYARLSVALAAVGGVSGLAAMSDEVKNLQSRIGLAIGDAGDLQDAWKKVGEVAQSTSSSLSATGDLFARVTKAGRDAGKAGQQAIDEALQITTAVNQAAQLSGASAQASEAAIKQLVQALQSGVLRGDEFNSVMEQAPRLAQALADGLGVTTGALREMAQDGKLSAEVVTEAIKSQASALEAEFGQLPQTVGRSVQNLTTQFQLWIGESREIKGVAALASSAMEALANNINLVARAAEAWGAVKIASKLKEWATAKLATAENTAATAENTAALGANAKAHTVAGAAASGHATQLGAATKATATNTAAHTTFGKAAQFATGMAGKLATGLKLLARSFAPLLAIDLALNIQEYGKALGEALAKMAGYKDMSEELAKEEERQARIAQENIARRKQLAEITRQAKEAEFELGEAALKALAQFDELTKKGKLAADAVKEISKSFDLTQAQGIADFGATLDKLAADNKLNAEQVREAWRTALDGQDLVAFEAKARMAFEGAQREGERVAMVMDALLQEAIARSGTSWEEMSGKLSVPMQQAMDNIDVLMQGFDSMTQQGVNAADALVKGFEAAIPKAETLEGIAALQGHMELARESGQLTEETYGRLAEKLEKMKVAAVDSSDAMLNLMAQQDEKLKQEQQELAITETRINAQKSLARQGEELARLTGNQSAVLRFKIEQMKLDIELTLARANVQRIEQQNIIAANNLRLKELKAKGLLTDAVRQEIEMSTRLAQARMQEADALEQSTRVMKKNVEQMTTESYKAALDTVEATTTSAQGWRQVADEAWNARDAVDGYSASVRGAPPPPSRRGGDGSSASNSGSSGSSTGSTSNTSGAVDKDKKKKKKDSFDLGGGYSTTTSSSAPDISQNQQQHEEFARQFMETLLGGMEKFRAGSLLAGGKGGQLGGTVNINLGGRRTQIGVTDAASAHSLETLLREIAGDKERAA